MLSRVVHDITIDSGFSESDMLGLGTEYRNIDPSKVPTLTLPVTVVSNYSFAGGTYGDVDFPSQPQDVQVIAQFLGAPAPGWLQGVRLTAAAASRALLYSFRNRRRVRTPADAAQREFNAYWHLGRALELVFGDHPRLADWLCARLVRSD